MLYLRLAGFAALGAFLLLLIDALVVAVAAWRRRRRAQGGVYGVVVDREGRTLGTYVDPLQAPRRAARVHGPGSVWAGPEPTAWAWEGQAQTEEEARHMANRVRYLHLCLLPELREARAEEDLSGEAGAEPWR